MLTYLYEKYPENDIVTYNYARCLAENKKFDESISYAYQLLDSKSQNSHILGYFIIFKIKNYLSDIDQNFVNDCAKKITRYQDLVEAQELNFVISFINNVIVKNNDNISKSKNILIYNPKSLWVEFQELPWNFSEVDDNLYGSGVIQDYHILPLKTLGITQIINLIEEKPPSNELKTIAKNNGIDIHYFPIEDRESTDIETIDTILNLITPNRKTLVHCMGGIGRTNMILVCYLTKKLRMSQSEATTKLSSERKVILTNPQILLAKKYYGHVNQPKGSNKFKKTALPGLIMLIGVPCSGKTTLSLEFQTYYNDKIVHINQDDMGNKDCWENFSSKAKQYTIILDRCNLKRNERQEWIKSYSQISSEKIIAICFQLDLSVCTERVKLRENHPSLSGKGGVKIIESLSKDFEPPSTKEGFSEIFIIKNDEDLMKIKNKFGFGNNVNTDIIMKFPRTKHLANLGSMSRDDLIFDSIELEKFMKMLLTVEEKIDGANMGLFLDEDGNIRAQNRSHFVNSSYHSQFKLLDKWILDHTNDLMLIFEKGNYIVFGEWVYMKHSINYTRLPDYFLIYDIYNRDNGDFLARNTLVELTKDTGLYIVPLIFEGKTTLDKLKEICVQTQSQFCDDQIEGIYVRAYENNILKYRGKIVRPNFICGDVHWTKGKYTINTLAR